MPHNEIEITPQSGTGLRRKARRYQLITHEDGELSMIIKIIFLHDSGIDLIDHFRSMIGEGEGMISFSQFEDLEKQFYPYKREHHTKGSFILPLTAELVPEGTEGAIPEIEWIRNLSVSQDLYPMLFGAGMIAEGEDRHVMLEEAFERHVMLQMDLLKRY